MLVDLKWDDIRGRIHKLCEEHSEYKPEEFEHLIPVQIKTGIYQTELNPQIFMLDTLNDYPEFNDRKLYSKKYNKGLKKRVGMNLSSFGVVDDVENLLSLYDFENDPRRLAITFTPIFKKDEPAEGGWRWHKWGPYYGAYKPQYEYLYDESIDKVMIYHIREIINDQ